MREEDSMQTQTQVTLEELLTTLRSEEHTSELQSQSNLVCRLLLAKKNARPPPHPPPPPPLPSPSPCHLPPPTPPAPPATPTAGPATTPPPPRPAPLPPLPNPLSPS